MWCRAARCVAEACRAAMPRPPRDERPSRAAKESALYRRECVRLGLNVRALREAQGLTLEQASERTTVAPKHLQKIEAGGINVTLVTLVRLAAGLKTSVHALFAPPPSASVAPEPPENTHD